jgi:anti-anti-sigma factor
MEPERLQITSNVQGNGLRLTISGEMNIYAALQMHHEFLNVLARDQNLEIDLSGVSEIDTSGFQQLYLLKRESEANRRSVRITAHSAATQEVLHLFGMNDYLGATREQIKSTSRKGKRRS